MGRRSKASATQSVRRCWTFRPELTHNAMRMPPFGVLNVNKPKGVTSRNAVNRVEWLVRPAKAGHAGTLDPLATGVLVICVGQATRLIRFVQRMRKRYLASFLLGHSSETDDLEREVIAIPNAVVPTRAMIDSVLPQFVGEIQQRPPAHSAIKIAGRRAYKLARRGETIDLAPRTVTIHSINVGRYEYPDLELAIECGSGTYIRALGRDVGEVLGTGALMSALHRSAIGSFADQDACQLADLTQDMLEKHIQPAVRAVSDLAQVVLTDAELE